MVASKILTAKSHFPSPEKFIAGENEKFSVCLFSLNSNVP